MEIPEINKDRLLRDLNAVSRIGLGEGGSVTRLVFSVHELRSRQLLLHLMNQAGLDVHVDAAGNIFGRLPAGQEGPAVLAGSHLDSVIQGGRYDGPVGVIGALEADPDHQGERRAAAGAAGKRLLRGRGIQPFRLFATLGSSLVAGDVTMDDFANAVDAGGARLEDVLSSFGIYRENLASLKRDPKTIKAYFELHIEQGPVLESRKKKIGVVTAIAAPSRFRVVFRGQADHSGTTPMEMRKDALVAAGYLITYIDEVCREHASADKGRVVGTVGAIKVEPGVINAIPGRDGAPGGRAQHHLRLQAQGGRTDQEAGAADRPGAGHESRGPDDSGRGAGDAASATDLTHSRTTCEERGIPFEVMPSGAGHDAMQMAKITPTGMIFIPSANGVSHNPTEWTDPEDICLGTQLLVETLLRAAHAEI